MDQAKFSEALSDVAKAFAGPEEIVTSGDLTRSQKVQLLEQWERDLRQLLVASEENMAGPGQGDSAERLRQVRDALGRLGATEDGADTGAAAGMGSPVTEDRVDHRRDGRWRGRHELSTCACYALGASVAVVAVSLGLLAAWTAGARAAAPRRRW